MRIAIYHNLPSGGAKRTLGESVGRLSGLHEIDVYTLGCADHQFADIRGMVSKHAIFHFHPTPLMRSPFGRINQAIRLFDLLRLKRLNQKIANIIERGKYDVVFVQPCMFEGSPSLLNYVSQTPSVFYCHETLRILYEQMPSRPYDSLDSPRRRLLNMIDPMSGLYRGYLQRKDRQNVRNAGVVLVNSLYSHDAIAAAYGVKPKVSYHGVDTNLFRPINLDRESWVLSVGSITPLKGFDFLIRTLAHIHHEKRPTLKIVSNFANPHEYEYLSQLARDLSVSIEMIIGVSDEELVRLYNKAALTVYAPINEPFGLIALESMACGTPIVAVDEGGLRESVVPNSVGLLVERDEDEFAHAISFLLQQPELCSDYGINGRKEVERKWTWERAVACLERALFEAAGNSPVNSQIADPIVEDLLI